MKFSRIDRTGWPREEYFEHYFSAVPCTYSMTTKVDITPIRRKGLKLYPVMLHSLATIVNRHEEFRTAINARGELGIYDAMIPCYTVFHKDTETFSTLWTDYVPCLEDFCLAYERDMLEYGNNRGMTGKPHVPENSFPVSMIPWSTFDGFNLNLKEGYTYLIPVFTMGKYVQENGKTLLPLAIQVHHAVCDGFHVCRFIQELNDLMAG